MAARVFRRLRDLLDVDTSGAADGDALSYDAGTETWIPGAGGGVTDHGALTGLADNDHPQYALAVDTATDVELAAAIAALAGTYQPLDGDLTAIAALSTTAFGRGLLILANQAALLAAAGAAAASHAHAGEDVTSGTVADARIASTLTRDTELTAAISAHEAAGDPHPGYTTAAELAAYAQPLDSDLTAIAALTTTAFGRAFLALADAAATRAALDLEPGTDFPSLATFNDHSARHENGGGDEISIAGLDGTSVELAAHLADATAAHAASAISVDSTDLDGVGTDLQTVLEELEDQIDAAAGGGAPTTLDYLVGTATGALSAEIAVGTTPGGELGGTWASPTVDATHSGSSHAAVQAAAEATAAAALGAHQSGIAGNHDADQIIVDSTTLVGTGTDVQAVLEELDNGIADHLADATAAHAASAIAFTPDGSIAATTVQAAIVEVRDEAGGASVAADEENLVLHVNLLAI